MQKILDKIASFKLAPQNRKEKFLNHFFENESKYLCLTQIGVLVCSFFLYPITKTFLTSKLIELKTQPLNIIDYFYLFVFSAIPCYAVCFSILLPLAKISEKYQKKLIKNYNNDILNYLTNPEDKEVQELLMKIKLINLYRKIPNSNLTANFEQYLNELEQDRVEKKEIFEIKTMLTSSSLHTQFFQTNKELLPQSVEELKLMIQQKIANQLKKEHSKQDKINHLINQFAPSNDAIFKQAKVLKANL